MYQPIDLMAALTMAREREHDLQVTLRQRQRQGQPAARRGPVTVAPEHAGRHHRLHDLLVRIHLAHAPSH